MKSEHVLQSISGFINNELSQSEKERVGEHLLQCEACRREHDEAKLGASLAAHLQAADAPEAVWRNIADAVEGRSSSPMGLLPQGPRLTLRNSFAFAAALIAVAVLSGVVYLNLFSGSVPTVASGPQASDSNSSVSPAQPAVNAATSDSANISNGQVAAVDTNSNIQNSNGASQAQPPPPSWQVETLAGMPMIGDGSTSAQIAVGQLLETDGRSRARIAIPDIGSVEIAPNSRVKLVGTSKDEHRLSLERGGLHAKILAPPRLFIVDTPSGKAVDLGCEYTLQVDRLGNSTLRVTSGFVALEDKGRESIVPAGMMCLTRKGKGLGTPFSAETNAEFRRALEQFDFANGGSSALQTMLSKADFYDMVTLWHLLSRVSKNERGAVFDRLAKYVPPPAGVTRDGILRLDKKMLSAWRAEVENTWFN